MTLPELFADRLIANANNMPAIDRSKIRELADAILKAAKNVTMDDDNYTEEFDNAILTKCLVEAAEEYAKSKWNEGAQAVEQDFNVLVGTDYIRPEFKP